MCIALLYNANMQYKPVVMERIPFKKQSWSHLLSIAVSGSHILFSVSNIIFTSWRLIIQKYVMYMYKIMLFVDREYNTLKDPATYSWNHGSSGFHSFVVPQFHVSTHRFVI